VVGARRLRELLGFKPKGLVIVEHGMPQVAFTTLVLQLYRAHNLTVATMDALVDSYRRVAFINLEEDPRLARSLLFDTARAAPATAGIAFEQSGCRNFSGHVNDRHFG
jgi:hypothetical protein